MYFRWDIESINRLPDYLQLFYSVIHNFVSELARDISKEDDITCLHRAVKLDDSNVTLRIPFPGSINDYIVYTWIVVDCSGWIWLKHIYKRQSGTTEDIHQAWKNILTTPSFQ